MIRHLRLGFGLLALFLGWTIYAAEPDKKLDQPDLSEYKTVETATAARIEKGGIPVAPRAGFLGLSVSSPTKGTVVVSDVSVDSPAAKAGLKPGDVVSKIDGKDVPGEGEFRDLLRTKYAGDTVKLSLMRAGKPVEATATLGTLSKPMASGKQRERASLGVRVATVKEGSGVVIEDVVVGSAAEKAKLKIGETILQVDGTAINDSGKLRDLLAEKKPEDTVTLTLLLADKNVDFKVKLGAELVAGGGSFDTRGNFGYWTRGTYRLGIILVEYPDAKHNAKIPPKAWEESMFAKGTYNKTSATGQPVYGSMYDYYLEQSYGHLKIEGKAFEYVEVSKKRADYATGNRSALLTEAMDKILARDGKDAFKDLDGVFFVYAGGRFNAARGSLYWPHRSSVRHNGKNWPYFICPESGSRGDGSARMTDISVFCHEFGHMLGLPDLYARPENPGMEGVGIWCAMANQAPNGKPQHFSAWSKDKLGWIKPTVIDPTVKQKLVLAPIEDSPKECFKVLARPDGSEYFLIENRKKKGFDAALPAEGLLIWRVVGNRPILEESHGVEGARGPSVFRESVPFPSASNDSFTPFTTPSSRSQLGGGLPVYITNIRRLADGRITFHIGYEYQ